MALGAQPGAADPNAAAGQTAQGQWAGADPSSYYSNYWGGESDLLQLNDIRLLIRMQGIMVLKRLGSKGRKLRTKVLRYRYRPLFATRTTAVGPVCCMSGAMFSND